MLRWMACGWSFRKTARAMSGARTECLHLPNHLYPLCILGLLFIVSPPASSPAALADAGIARDREKARGECFWSPGLMGGLAGGRVRSRNSRGIPKKKSCSLNCDPGLRVLIIYNMGAPEIFNFWNPPFLRTIFLKTLENQENL